MARKTKEETKVCMEEEIKILRNQNIFNLKMTGIILISILAFINIIGIYWGKDGLMSVGILFTILCLLVLFLTTNTGNDNL